MFWYLLFCAAGYKGGVVCTPPQRMPDEATCRFIADRMARTAGDVGRDASGRCVSTKKVLPR